MGASESLEEIVEQTAFAHGGAKRGKGRRHIRWGVSPTLTRAKPSREKKNPKSAAPKPAAIKQRPAPPAAPARLGQAITDYQTLLETLRQRAAELALSRAELDRLSGVADGYSGKIFSMGSGTAKVPKRMGLISLGPVLATLGLKIVLIEDEVATARTLALRSKPVDTSQQRFGNHSRSGSILALSPPENPALDSSAEEEATAA